MHELVEVLAARFAAGETLSITQIRKIASQVMCRPIKAGTADAKKVEEAAELALVMTARRICRIMATYSPVDVFNTLVDLYDRQPRLCTRSSSSVLRQQYSTPLPIAYLVSYLAGIRPYFEGSGHSVYEPTAGNGALLINSNPMAVWANEIDPDRAAALKHQGYPRVGIFNAILHVAGSGGSMKRIVANPPFGKIAGSKNLTIAGGVAEDLVTNELDQAIAWQALRLLDHDGKAAIILGSERAKRRNIDPVEQRARAYNSLVNRRFFKQLFDNFNVVDMFTIDGSLYEKQGAGYPIDVILIDGRGKSSLPLPAASPPRIYTSYEDLAELLPKEAELPDFRMYFSGVDGERNLNALLEAQISDILLDPSQYQKLEGVLPKDLNLILDSGAYAEMKDGRSPMSLEDYRAIVNRAHCNGLRYAVAKDVFGDQEKTLENWQELKRYQYPWMPVWTFGLPQEPLPEPLSGRLTAKRVEQWLKSCGLSMESHKKGEYLLIVPIGDGEVVTVPLKGLAQVVDHAIVSLRAARTLEGNVATLQKLLTEAPVVGVGGLVPYLRNESTREKAIAHLLELCKRYPRRLHLFGLFDPDAITWLMPYAASADTSGWLSLRSGKQYVIEGNRLLRVEKSGSREVRSVISARTLNHYCNQMDSSVAERAQDELLDEALEKISGTHMGPAVLMDLTFAEAEQYLERNGCVE